MNTPETYADLLKARGDIPIETLRQIKQSVDGLLALIDELDTTLGVKPSPTGEAIAAALRAKFPDFQNKSDAEVLDYFGVNVK